MGGTCSTACYCDPSQEYTSNTNLECAPKQAPFTSGMDSFMDNSQRITNVSITQNVTQVLYQASQSAYYGGGGGGHEKNQEQEKLRKRVVKVQAVMRGYLTRKYLGITNFKQLMGQHQTVNSRYFTQEEALETIQVGRTLNLSTQKREQHAPYTYKSGALYSGTWLGGFRDGFGQMSWPDGALYVGDWLLNKAHGQGKFVHAEGDVYEGRWWNDKAWGRGRYEHVNGARYEGEWRDDLQHGYGFEQWVDGSSYLGQYNLGQKEGIGFYRWSDGSEYEGQWLENKINGLGIYTWLDGRNYEGQWSNNNMDGVGCYRWADGRRYEGEYSDDKKHGYGVYWWSDGRVYKGYWYRGKQHGLGQYKTAESEQMKYGLWEDGKRVKWFDELEAIAISNDQLDYSQYFTLATSTEYLFHPAFLINYPPEFAVQLQQVRNGVDGIRDAAQLVRQKVNAVKKE